jgi:hypothetical protein
MEASLALKVLRLAKMGNPQTGSIEDLKNCAAAWRSTPSALREATSPICRIGQWTTRVTAFNVRPRARSATSRSDRR